MHHVRAAPESIEAGDAKARQKQQSSGSSKAVQVQAKAKPLEPAHKFFVSHNWKQLVQKRPELAPKASEAAAPRRALLFLKLGVGRLADFGTSLNAFETTSVVALDCEMVGVGPAGKESVLARVSIVDSEGKVTDFRTHITGITPGTFKRPGVISEEEARAEAAKVLDGKIVLDPRLRRAPLHGGMAAALLEAVVSDEDAEATLLPFVHARFRPLLPAWFSKKAEPFLPAEGLEQYRSSLRERCGDVVEDLAAWAVRCKAWILSSPVVRALLVLVARVSFVADLALDINVGLELRASGNFWWSGICFSIIAFTYLVLVIALREKAVERLQSCCLAERPMAAMMLWFLLGVPLLIATDIFVTLRYLWQDPLDVEVFHFLKLRGLLEAVEAMLQTLLQSYVAFRLYNPGGFFAQVEAKQVKPAALCLSIMFSIKVVVPEDDVCPGRWTKDLGLVARSELWVLARAVRDSPVLEELRFAKASFLRVLVRSPTETNVLAGWVDGTVIGFRLVDEEIWEAVLQVGEDLYVAAGLQRLTKHLGLLLSLGASPNGDGKKLPLIGAALLNASGNAQLLLEQRADVDATSGKGLTALYGAAQANAAQTLQLLLKHRAEVNLAIGPKKLTPLHAAARGTCNEALLLLLEHQADSNKASADGVTALHVACEASHLNALSSVEVLLAHKADVNVTTASQRTPLHFALRSPSIELGTALLRPLLAHRANLNQADSFGSALLASRADVSRVNEHGCTALLEAAAQNSVQCARVLLEFRSDVNHRESGRGETALMKFGMRQSAEGLRLLLEARADPTLKTTDGYRVARFRIGDGLVSVNGKTERFLHRPLQPGDVVSVDARQVRAVQLRRQSGQREEDPLPRGSETAKGSLRLLEHLHLREGLSLNEARCAIREGRVQIDGVPVRDPARSWEAEDAATLGTRIVQEERDFAVVWKPAGISVSDCAAMLPKIGVLSPLASVMKDIPKQHRAWSSPFLDSSLLRNRRRAGACCAEPWAKTRSRAAALCHVLVVVDCDVSAPSDAWRPADQRFELLRPRNSTRWIRGRGQLQVLECVCRAPLCGAKLFASSLAALGYHILGSKGVRGRPLKSIIGWTLDLPHCTNFKVEEEPPAPAQLMKAFEDAREAWQRHQEAAARRLPTDAKEWVACSQAAESSLQISYAQGSELFCSHQFRVSESVMVPRRGTEAVAQRAAQELKALKGSPGPRRLLDLGTGSGCIAISALLALKEGSEAEAVGLDSSAEALAVARSNAEKLLRTPWHFRGVEACFSDLGSPSLARTLMDSNHGFDVVVANPPYLTRAQAEELLGPRAEAKEPWQAFVFQRTAKVKTALQGHKGDVDGAIAAYAVLLTALDSAQEAGFPLLKEGGALVLEVPAALEASVRRLVLEAPRAKAQASLPPRSCCPVCCWAALGLWLPGAGGASRCKLGLRGSLCLEERFLDASGVFRGFALLLSHPHVLIRDTSLFRPLRPPEQKRTPSLRKLAQHWLQETIQEGTHDSVMDARIALRLYALKSKIWEKHMRPAMQHRSGAGRHPAVVDTEEEDDGERVDREEVSQTRKPKKRRASGPGAADARPKTTRKKAMKKKKKKTAASG
eukprot:s792_g23.t2